MTFLVSLLLGLIVGVVYALLRVTPPAPPLVALVGLLGMLAGETAVNWARANLASGRAVAQGHADGRSGAKTETGAGAAHGG